MKHVIIEGIDRLGKDTLIKGIQDRLGFFQVIHYQKPQLLEKYVTEAKHRNVPEADVKREALKLYQQESFRAMFKLMAGMLTPRIICNRAHLGETVYAKRYRGYDGSYVFDIEKQFSYTDGPLSQVLLVVLHTSDFSFITDDGLSLDVTKREEEQADFIEAYHKSSIPNKLLLDVHNGKGGFVSPQFVLDSVVSKLK
jgi:thymidylate kinase